MSIQILELIHRYFSPIKLFEGLTQVMLISIWR